jgi:hypothetical protein
MLEPGSIIAHPIPGQRSCRCEWTDESNGSNGSDEINAQPVINICDKADDRGAPQVEMTYVPLVV